MTQLILVGCRGRMAGVFERMATESGDFTVVAGIDERDGEEPGYPVYRSWEDCLAARPFGEGQGVVVDFSSPRGLGCSLPLAVGGRFPLLVAATGHGPHLLEAMEEAGRVIPVLHAPNLSLGMGLLTRLVREAVEGLGEGFDVEIIERHHRNKQDAPSGTALLLLEAVREGADHPVEPVYSRRERVGRGVEEVGIHSVRGGSLVGEHEVLFAGPGECLSITHRAQSREIFAAGAVEGCRFLSEAGPGYYGMEDLLGWMGR